MVRGGPKCPTTADRAGEDLWLWTFNLLSGSGRDLQSLIVLLNKRTEISISGLSALFVLVWIIDRVVCFI